MSYHTYHTPLRISTIRELGGVKKEHLDTTMLNTVIQPVSMLMFSVLLRPNASCDQILKLLVPSTNPAANLVMTAQAGA